MARYKFVHITDIGDIWCERQFLYQAIKNYLPQARGRQHNHMRYTKNYMYILLLR